MSTTKEIVRTCDHCKKRVSNEGRTVLTSYKLPDPKPHPHTGWFILMQQGGRVINGAYAESQTWDLCSIECLNAIIKTIPLP